MSAMRKERLLQSTLDFVHLLWERLLRSTAGLCSLAFPKTAAEHYITLLQCDRCRRAHMSCVRWGTRVLCPHQILTAPHPEDPTQMYINMHK